MMMIWYWKITTPNKASKGKAAAGSRAVKNKWLILLLRSLLRWMLLRSKIVRKKIMICKIITRQRDLINLLLVI